MSYSLIDRPRFLAPEVYERAIENMLARLANTDGVVSVYQVGGIHTPGISDADLVVVFKEGISCQEDFRDKLNADERYIFIHALYGAEEKMFVRSGQYTFFHHYKLLYGKDRKGGSAINTEEEKILKQQIALEFLLKMYIVMTVQRCYRIIKLRSLLLEAKAILYDLEFLGISKGKMFDLVTQVIELRETWFEKKKPDSEIIRWFEDFYMELETHLKEDSSGKLLYAPGISSFNAASNIAMTNGRQLEWKRKGFTLPSFTASVFGKKQFNLHHRFNRFQFSYPMENRDVPLSLSKRFELLKQMTDYNKEHLPHFLPLSSSLKMF